MERVKGTGSVSQEQLVKDRKLRSLMNHIEYKLSTSEI